MIEKCPLCGTRLQIGTDTKRKEYDPEYRAKFEAGEITLDELLQHVHTYTDRTLLCPNSGTKDNLIHADGSEDTLNPPCPNYFGKDGHTMDNPHAIVETVTFED